MDIRQREESSPSAETNNSSGSGDGAASVPTDVANSSFYDVRQNEFWLSDCLSGDCQEENEDFDYWYNLEKNIRLDQKLKEANDETYWWEMSYYRQIDRLGYDICYSDEKDCWYR